MWQEKKILKIHELLCEDVEVLLPPADAKVCILSMRL
jgi:hypothetical protein